MNLPKLKKIARSLAGGWAVRPDALLNAVTASIRQKPGELAAKRINGDEWRAVAGRESIFSAPVAAVVPG